MFLRTFSLIAATFLFMACPAGETSDPEASDGSADSTNDSVDSGSTNGDSMPLDTGGLDLTTDGSTEGSTDGNADGAADGASADAGSSDGSSDGSGDCDTLRVQVKGLFENGTYEGRSGSVGNCTSCHTDPASGYSASYMDMRSSYDLYERVSSDDMPMSGDSWSEDDKLILRSWINCGRPW